MHTPGKFESAIDTQMEMISRCVYGFRNFENHRTRVLVQCGWVGV